MVHSVGKRAFFSSSNGADFTRFHFLNARVGASQDRHSLSGFFFKVVDEQNSIYIPKYGAQ